MPRRRHISVPCLVEVNLLFPFVLCPIYAEFAMQMLECPQVLGFQKLCWVQKNQEISGAWRRLTMRALDEESSESNVAMEDRQLTPEEEQDQEDISNILKV